MRQHLHPERAEERLAHRSDRDPRGGLPRARPFEHVPRVGEPVLLHPDQVGVAGPRARQRRILELRLFLFDGHDVLPLRPFGVVDQDRDRRADRAAVADPAEDLEAVLFDLHPRPAAVAHATTRELRA